MKKVALVFVLAVFVPSLVLAWLAVRSLRDQQFLLERQQSLLYQGVADAMAAKVQDALAEDQHTFTLKVTAMLRDGDSRAVARSFDSRLCKDWPLAQVGFAVTMTGEILSPSPQGRPEARTFYTDNGRFLANRESAEVYLNPKQAFSNYQSPAAQTQSPVLPQADLNPGSSRQSQTATKEDQATAPGQQSGSLPQDTGSGKDRPQSGPQTGSALANNAPDKGLAAAQNSMALNEGNTYLNNRSVFNQKLEMRNVVPQRQAELFQNGIQPRFKGQQLAKPAAPPLTNTPAEQSLQIRNEGNARLDQQAQVD